MPVMEKEKTETKGAEETPILYLVIPCYNEEEVLPETARQLTERLSALMEQGLVSAKSRMLFVDDGSRDKTWEIISSLSGENPYVCGLKLAHNRGHQNALLAGLMEAKNHADCVISLDADLQDDIGVLPQFVEKFGKAAMWCMGCAAAGKRILFSNGLPPRGFTGLWGFWVWMWCITMRITGL